jgi:hypothetical protein
MPDHFIFIEEIPTAFLAEFVRWNLAGPHEAEHGCLTD